MDAETLRETVETERESELSRLGSDRRLVALTGADLGEERVLTAALSTEAAAETTFAAWHDSAADPEAATVFETVAATERDHRDQLLAELDDDVSVTERENRLHSYLRELTATPARVGAGLIARPLVGSQTLLQFVNFFVNEADDRRADLFRGFRSDTEAQLTRGLELVETVCASTEDWEDAERAALQAVDVVYEQYTDSLAALGLDPQPVC